MWTPYDTINASLLLFHAPPYDEGLVANLLEDLRVYRDERQEIYQRAIVAEHKLFEINAEAERLRRLLAESQSDNEAAEHELAETRSEVEQLRAWIVAACKDNHALMPPSGVTVGYRIVPLMTRSTLEQAAFDWWKSHRPMEWMMRDHLDNPGINCTNATDRRLAEAVAEFAEAEPYTGR